MFSRAIGTTRRRQSKALEGGWYHTGDLMRRGEGDEIWFVARKKDIIIRGGTNISPIEVEEALVACHPAVKEAAVVGVPEPSSASAFLALSRLTANTEKLVVSENSGERRRKRLAAYKIPEDMKVLDKLPLTALGKFDRQRLQKTAPHLFGTDQSRSRDARHRLDQQVS